MGSASGMLRCRNCCVNFMSRMWAVGSLRLPNQPLLPLVMQDNLQQYVENKYVVESTGWKELPESINGRAAM